MYVPGHYGLVGVLRDVGDHLQLVLLVDGLPPRLLPEGRVKKFLLNRLVKFSIKWVGGYCWPTKEKCENKRHVKSGWGRGVLVDF